MEPGLFKLLFEHLGFNKEAYLLLGIFVSNTALITQQRVRKKEVDGKFENQNTKIDYIEKDSKEAKEESSQALEVSKDTKRLVETIKEDVEKIDDRINSIDKKVETVIIKLEEKYERYGRAEEEKDKPSEYKNKKEHKKEKSLLKMFDKTINTAGEIASMLTGVRLKEPNLVMKNGKKRAL